MYRDNESTRQYLDGKLTVTYRRGKWQAFFTEAPSISCSAKTIATAVGTLVLTFPTYFGQQ